ncbi:MAG: hypothetical protein D6E12_05005 [Desulfovibrio sp.]|nr:MAG: hypothetical protein D6E12_05005 [Desulfovibrio sp.]
MRRWNAVVWGLAILVMAVMVFAAGVQAQSTGEAMDEAGLIAGWERLVQSDPETQVFERIEEKRYRFVTTRFPYDGEIEVINTSIDSTAGMYEYEYGYSFGVVEVDLSGVDDEFYRRHGASYGQFLEYTFLYYDADQEKWLASWELDYGGIDDASCSLSWWSFFNEYLVWLLFLLILIVVLIFSIRKSSRHMKKALAGQDQALSDQKEALDLARQSTELQKESLAVLREIREKLGAGSPDPE